MASPYAVALIPAPNRKAALKLAKGIVEGKLGACVNVVPGVQSVYRWKGKTERSAELLLIVKTRRALIPRLSTFVKGNHPYSVPELVALDIEGGLKAYLDWLGAETKPS